MSLEGVVGRRYGPANVSVDPARVAQFVEAVGEDPDRWETFAPPSFASALLFAVAPAFLADPDVTPFTSTLIHSDQRFAWSGPMAVGGSVDVSAEVVSARERRGLWFVGFSARATGGGTVVESDSTFILSDASAGEPVEAVEPPALAGSLATPVEVDGAEVATVRSVSRADLVRYASASQDFNPIHWDHDSAVAAGFPGVVAHGLLMLSWMVSLGAAVRTGAHPVAEVAARFRKPLLPATECRVVGEVGSEAAMAVRVEAEGDTLVTGTVTLT